jgi:hypothetical protein
LDLEFPNGAPCETFGQENTRLIPTTINETATELDVDAVLTEVLEVGLGECSDNLSSFDVDDIVVGPIIASANFLTVNEERVLSKAFVESYNDFAHEFCDPLSRVLESSSLEEVESVESPDTQTQKVTLVLFSVRGMKRGLCGDTGMFDKEDSSRNLMHKDDDCGA